VPPDCLEWNFRFGQIIKTIEQVNADVVCLQEVDHFKMLDTKLSSLGYHGDFMLRKDAVVHHGVALFYKSAKFDLVDTFKEYLHEENNQTGTQGFLVNVLREKSSNKSVAVAVVHLKAKRPFAERRYFQTKSALNVLRSVLEKHPQKPLVWAGDFNGETTEPFHKEIADSSFGFVSSYADILGKEPGFTTWKIRPSYEEKHTIDYIWFTGQNLKVENVLLPMTDEQVPEGRYPSYDHPSDHIALCTDFEFL